MDLNTVNILVFAYIGDSIYELMIRNYLINKGINKVNKLQTMAKNYVTAKAQAKFITKLLDENLLTNEEMYNPKRDNATFMPPNAALAYMLRAIPISLLTPLPFS